jgi:hypothetical protein
MGGFPYLTPAQIEHGRRLIDQDGLTVKATAELLGVHHSERWLNEDIQRHMEIDGATKPPSAGSLLRSPALNGKGDEVISRQTVRFWPVSTR